MVRVLLVDDRELVRAGIKLQLKDAKNIDLIGEVKNGEDAIRTINQLMPDVVLMGLNMTGMGGFEAVMRLLRNEPTLKILILSAYINGMVPSHLLDLGVCGYLSKHSNREEMMRAIQIVKAGDRYIDPSIVDAITSFRIQLQNNQLPIGRLTYRELQILIMIANGIERHEIAKNLYLSTKTISAYVIIALNKLGANTEAEAVRMIIESGLFDIGS